MKRELYFVWVILLFCSGCHKEEVMTFSEDSAGIFFQRLAFSTMEGIPISYTDSLKVSFANAAENVTQRTYNVSALITGKAVDYDRKIKVVVDEERTTAVLGKHFTIDTDTLYIPANTCKCNVPVTLIRDPELLKVTFRITLKLMENENFRIIVDEYKSLHSWSATAGNLDATRFKIIFDEKYTEPGYWKNMDTFGAFSVAKYLLVNELMEWTADDWKNAGMSGQKIGSGKAPFAAILMQKELQKRADTGNPLKDENGQYVQLPDPYEVDYSRYQGE